MPDYSASREKNDLGYLTFDLQTDILCILDIEYLNDFNDIEIQDLIHASRIFIFLTKLAYVHLTPLFNWNVKQLFLYLTAEYQTENNEFNQVDFLCLYNSHLIWYLIYV